MIQNAPADLQATLSLLLPETVLAAGIPAVLLADMVLGPARKAAMTWLGVAVCGAAALAAVTAGPGHIDGMLVVDGLVPFVRLLVLAITAAVLLVATCLGVPLSRYSLPRLPQCRPFLHCRRHG